MFLSSSVGGQEHCPIKSRGNRGFFYLWDQVLVIDRCQELDPIPDGAGQVRFVKLSGRLTPWMVSDLLAEVHYQEDLWIE
jgi:hypothetical protein